VIKDRIVQYLSEPPAEAGPIYNERSVQLELGYAFRRDGFQVEFERPFRVPRQAGSTLKPKQNLDLLVRAGVETAAIELKVPLNGQHPETMYAFCADIEFVEALKQAGVVNHGFCLMFTNDRTFWEDSGRGSAIHDAFRCVGKEIGGLVQKPTGARDSAVMLSGGYRFAEQWRGVAPRLLPNARLLLVQV
jgi:hypothetical protein